MKKLNPYGNPASTPLPEADPVRLGDTSAPQGYVMPDLPNGTTLRSEARRAGKVRPMVLLWALGVPLPIVLIILLVRGC